MSKNSGTTVHASCVLIGRSAVLIRGASGSGKSALALKLIEASHAGKIPPAMLVADDRVFLEISHGRLLARAPDAIAGKIEVRGLGIRNMPHEPLALVSLVVDLGAVDAARMPEQASEETGLAGVKLSRLPFATPEAAFTALLASFNPVTKS